MTRQGGRFKGLPDGGPCHFLTPYSPGAREACFCGAQLRQYEVCEDDRLTALALRLDTPKGATEVPREPALGPEKSEERRKKRRATGRI